MRSVKSAGAIEIDRILQILPHRWPFVLIDRVTEVVPGERIAGHKCVSMGELWFQGHFPQRPITYTTVNTTTHTASTKCQ